MTRASAPTRRPPRAAIVAVLLVLAMAAGATLPLGAPLALGRTIAAAIPGAAAARAMGSAIVPGAVDRSSLAIEATYDVDARLSWADRSLAATVTIGATNRSGDAVDRLELNTIAASIGGLRVREATVDGTPMTVAIDDQTISVPLGGILPHDATATIRIAFTARLRSDLDGSNWLFTRANGIASLYRWIPWVSKRTPFARPNHGDPFVTATSPLVVVRLTTDRTLRVAATGRRVAVDGRTQTFRAEHVRDVVLAAAPDYRTTTTRVGGTTIRVWTRPGGPAAALRDAARRALARMEPLVGPLPATELDVVQSSGRFGMEGPGIVWIPTGVAAANIPYLVAHEVAHQWFYGVVGNDQAREPFADEATADFLARHVLGARRASRCSTQPLDRSIYRYGPACYYEIVYIQGGNLLDDARRRMGTARFFRALRGYVEAHAGGLAHTADLLGALDAATPLDLRARYAARFPSLD